MYRGMLPLPSLSFLWMREHPPKNAVYIRNLLPKMLTISALKMLLNLQAKWESVSFFCGLNLGESTFLWLLTPSTSPTFSD